MNRLVTGALAFLISICVLSGHAVESTVIEEIVVTAQKREQSAEDVGIAITAFSGDQIEALGFQSSIDVVAHTPGMTFGTPTAEGNNANLSLRGVALNDFNDNNESPVAVYIDDVYVSAIAGATFQLFDIERVEVLRGPQGTLFGRNTSGGLVHFVTRKPANEYGGKLSVTAGENSQISSQFVLNVPMGDTAAARLSLAQNRFDGYVDNRVAGVREPNDADSLAGRLQLLFNPSDTVDLLVNVHWSEEDSVDGSWQHQATKPAGALGDVSVPLPASEDFYGTCPGCDGFGYRDTDSDPWEGDYDRGAPLVIKNVGGSIQVNVDLTDALTLTSISAYEEYERYFGEDTDLGPFPGIVPTFDSKIEQFTQELRLAGGSDTLRWVGGLYFFDSDATGTIDAGVVSLDGTAPACNRGACRPPAEDFLIFYSNYWDQDTTSWSAFGQVEFDLSEAFTLIAGLRYTDEERDMELLAVDLSGFLVGMGAPDNIFADFTHAGVGDLTENDSDNVTGKVELDWRLAEDTLLYGFVSRGTKAAAFNGGLLDFQGVFNSVTPQAVPVDEETITAYEVGMKTRLFDGLGRLSLSAFYYDYADFQAFQFSNFGQIIFNTDATVAGGEVEFAVSPTERLDLLLGVGWIAEAEAEDIVSPAGRSRDRDMVLAPELQLNTVLRYTIPIGESSLALQWDGFYQTEQYFDIQNHPVSESDAYSVWNARAIWTSADDKWNVTAWVNNVFEEEYLVYTFDFTAAFGYNQLGYGRPRWAGITVGYEW